MSTAASFEIGLAHSNFNALSELETQYKPTRNYVQAEHGF
jgi:hypothetical protein